MVLDGAEVGRLRRRETLEIDVAEGHHHLTVRIEWAGSPEIYFSVRDKEVVAFVCHPELVFSLLDLLRPNQWVVLTRVGE